MPPHEPPPDDYEPISELILILDLNDEKEDEDEAELDDLPLYQIVGLDNECNTVPFPQPPWDLEQLPIPIFGNQNVFCLVLNVENSHLFPIISVPLQQTVGNVPL